MPSTDPREQAERVNILLGQVMRRLFWGTGKTLKTPDLTTGQLRVLRILGHYENCTMKDLAKMANVSMPTATGLVDRMVEDGLAVRADDPNDRRVVRVKLTRKAKNIRRKWQQRRREKIDRLLTRLGAKDRSRFVEAVETIHEILERLEEPETA